MSSEEPRREPCLHCGESAALVARICPHCKQSLLVDVRLQQGLRDARSNYGLARALSRIPGSGAPSLVDLKATLSEPRGVVCRGVTRDVAATALDVLKGFGASGQVELHRPKSKLVPARPTVIYVAAGAAALLASAVGLAWLLSGREAPEEVADAPTVLPTLTTVAIAAASGPSTVSLTCGAQVGSGFFVSPDRLVTNAHVVCRDNAVDVHFQGGRKLKGTVVSRDEKLDLAVVEVKDSGAAPLAIADGAALQPGDKVVIIGTPLGMDQTVVEGIVSHVGRNIAGIGYIQLDANVNPGNSGGPVFNDRGQIVGVVTLKAGEGSGIGFALPINYVYEGESALVKMQVPASAAWHRLLAQVRDAQERERERARTLFTNPALVAAKAAPSRRDQVFLVILMRSPVHPARERLEAAFEREGTQLCQSYIDIREWRSLDDITTQMGDELPPDVQWLMDHGQGNQLWYGPGLMGSNDCADVDLRSADVVLREAETGFERATVEP